MPASPTLTIKEQFAFEKLIDDSIITRYDGDLERCDLQDGGYFYIPLDTDNIRELLVQYWGTSITADMIEDAFTRLTKDGAEEWPRAWCEEDIEETREQRLNILDYEIECAEKQVTKLKEEQQQLHDAGFDRWYAQERRAD